MLLQRQGDLATLLSVSRKQPSCERILFLKFSCKKPSTKHNKVPMTPKNHLSAVLWSNVRASSHSISNMLHITYPHPSALVTHTSHLTPHTSHLTPHTSHLTPHTSHLTPRTVNYAFPLCKKIAALYPCSKYSPWNCYCSTQLRSGASTSISLIFVDPATFHHHQ